MIGWVERLYCIVGIAFLGSAFFPRTTAADTSSSDPKMLLIQGVVYGVLFVFCLMNFQTVMAAAIHSWMLCMLLAFVVASACWSTAYDVTLRRCVLLIATTLFGLYFGSRFEREEQIFILSNGIALLGVMSVGVAMLKPGYGLDSDAHLGALRGVFPHKNMLGRMMVLGFCSWFSVTPRSRPAETLRVFGILLCLTLIVLSRSRDAILIGFVLWACSAIALRLKRSTVLVLLFGTIALLTAGFVLFPSGLEGALMAMGRDPTLTGRTEIWATVIDAIRQRPLFGYGFASFWRGLDGPSISVIAAADWMVPHSHNGYLDLLLDLGFIGMTVFAIGLWGHTLRAAKSFRLSGTRANWWPLLFATFLLLYNIGESSILKPNSLFWAMYVATFTVVLQSPDQRRMALTTICSTDLHIKTMRKQHDRSTL